MTAQRALQVAFWLVCLDILLVLVCIFIVLVQR
jgi:hypothetical protein